MQTSNFSAQIKVKPIITCRGCNKSTTSSTIQFTVSGNDISELDFLVDMQLKQKFVEPGVGWSVSGNGIYDCPVCSLKRQAEYVQQHS